MMTIRSFDHACRVLRLATYVVFLAGVAFAVWIAWRQVQDVRGLEVSLLVLTPYVILLAIVPRVKGLSLCAGTFLTVTIIVLGGSYKYFDVFILSPSTLNGTWFIGVPMFQALAAAGLWIAVSLQRKRDKRT
jgi:hypothetical protein